ncbi:polysaccharide biosynthesis/export family protein [Gemmata sp.]|uniref:polysaccharide biosynthesis/export family protein n=1 Tax=Gemmata sp. TaxID=1914242 RepID=UPI003F728F21
MLLCVLCAGCADCKFLRKTCPPPPDPLAAAQLPAPDTAYRIGCPDVLEVAFADRPEWDVLASVDLDGRVALAHPGSPRVEGRTLDDVRHELARLAGTDPDNVTVRLAAARSSRVFLHGPIRGRCRVVPYQGPEPVIDFLKRVGGLPPGSKLNQVYVVRPNVASGKRPEVFQVDVSAVLADNNHATNVPLMPSDEVYIGETKRSVVARILPDWLGPLYRRLSGLLPEDWWPWTRPRTP